MGVVEPDPGFCEPVKVGGRDDFTALRPFPVVKAYVPGTDIVRKDEYDIWKRITGPEPLCRGKQDQRQDGSNKVNVLCHSGELLSQIRDGSDLNTVPVSGIGILFHHDPDGIEAVIRIPEAHQPDPRIKAPEPEQVISLACF